MKKNKKKKIILVPEYFYPRVGGVENVVYHLAKELQKLNYDVRIFCLNSPYFQKFYENYDGIKIYRFYFILPLNTKQKLLFPFLFPFTILHLFFVMFFLGKVDIVNIHFVKNQFPYLLLFKKIFKYKLVLSFHGSDINKFILTSSILKKLLRLSLKNNPKIHAVSKFLSLKLKKEFPDIKNITIIPNGISLEEFKPVSPFFQKDEYIFTWGRFVEEKGFEFLIKLMKHLPSHIHLIIAGYGSLYRKYLDLIQLNNLEERVKIYNNISRKQIISLLKGAKFVIIPSLKESFGLTTLEAMANGKAIIVAQKGGLPELVENNVNGFVIPRKNINSWIKLIILLWQNEELRAYMEKVNLEKSKTFSWDKIVKKYLNFYEI